MNGAESLVRTLLKSGVHVCFANPGTSEMHFVAALDRVQGMRCVLGLFEGVVTAAADGYARMADKPASTLLHLGPGLGNGLANLHNARKANTPLVNIVGEHATRHLEHDAPLTADIEGIAGPVSGWVRTSTSARAVAHDGAEAVAAARTPPGQVATLILPANTAWDESDGAAEPLDIPAPATVTEETVFRAASALRSGEPAVLMLGGAAVRSRALDAAGRIANATGARLLAETFNSRRQRGAGRVAVERLPYPVDQALDALAGTRHLVLAGAKVPVAFFAYPNKPSLLHPEDCALYPLANRAEDVTHALEWLADELGAPANGMTRQALDRPALPTESGLDAETCGAAIGALLPENAVVVDEAITSGRMLDPCTRGAPPHDWLQLTGGAIGIGLPLATGAAVACPGRKVVGLQADGSAMYTVQALWTQAREGLDVTTVLFANRAYAILQHELALVGAHNPGRNALDMLDIGRPDLGWVALARGMGLEAEQVTTTEQFIRALRAGLSSQGPYLIEVIL